MVDSDVVYGKIDVIQRCLRRIKQTSGNDAQRLDDLDTQDVVVLNFQRAVQAAIDLAAHVVASEGLGVPQELRDHFKLRADAKNISPEIREQMHKMVGFRDIAVHEYQKLDPEVLKSILRYCVSDIHTYSTATLRHFRLGTEPRGPEATAGSA
jgi:uncharacterized protein YutE (UPF0331/DUF86 family)